MKNIACLLFVFFLLDSGNELLGQTLKNNNQTVQQAIKAIEADSDYIFNYDPLLINGYTYSGEIDLTSINNSLDEIFYNSPLYYEIDGTTILVFKPNPKSYRICGTLLDFENESPLIAASISVRDSTIGSQTNNSGFFELECTLYKNQEIEISYLGYNTIRFSVQELTDDCQNWYMEINPNLFGKEIIISDYLIDGISLGNEFSGFNLDYNQLSKNYSNVEHDIFKTAQLLPGINSIDDSASNLQIRGSNSGQNLVLWEGVPLYNSGHVFGMISAINPFSVDNVSIYKGAHNPRFDNRVGGILDISLSDDISSAFSGSAGTTMTELHTNLSIPLIKNYLMVEVAGRQSLNKLFNSPTLKSYTNKVFQYTIIDEQNKYSEEEQIRNEQTLGYQDWNAKILFRPIERLLIKGSIYNNSQNFDYSFWLNEDIYMSEDKINLSTQILSLQSELQVTNIWSTDFSIHQSLYNNIYEKRQSENGIQFNRNDQFNRIKEQSATFSNEIQIGPKFKIIGGYEYNIKEVELDLGDEINFDIDFVPIEVEKANFHNLFQSLSYSNKKMQIDFGNRSSYYQELNRWFHSPRINIKYSINKSLTFKADAGIYHQFISQLTNVGAYQIKVDNPLWIMNANGVSLSQSANKMAAGFVYQKGKWLLDIDFYNNRIENISTITPQLGIIPEISGFTTGVSNVTGMDLLIKKGWSSGINTWLNYSLAQANYNFPDISEDNFISPTDIRHNISFVSSYKYKNFQLGSTINYHSGLPYSQAQLTLNEFDPYPEPPFLYYLDYYEFNGERLDPYLRLDLNASYRFNFKPIKNSQFEISCSLLNLLNRSNVVAREFFVNYNESTEEYKLTSIQKTLLNRTSLLLLRYYW